MKKLRKGLAIVSRTRPKSSKKRQLQLESTSIHSFPTTKTRRSSRDYEKKKTEDGLALPPDSSMPSESSDFEQREFGGPGCNLTRKVSVVVDPSESFSPRGMMESRPSTRQSSEIFLTGRLGSRVSIIEDAESDVIMTSGTSLFYHGGTSETPSEPRPLTMSDDKSFLTGASSASLCLDTPKSHKTYAIPVLCEHIVDSQIAEHHPWEEPIKLSPLRELVSTEREVVLSPKRDVVSTEREVVLSPKRDVVSTERDVLVSTERDVVLSPKCTKVDEPDASKRSGLKAKFKHGMNKLKDKFGDSSDSEDSEARLEKAITTKSSGNVVVSTERDALLSTVRDVVLSPKRDVVSTEHEVVLSTEHEVVLTPKRDLVVSTEREVLVVLTESSSELLTSTVTDDLGMTSAREFQTGGLEDNANLLVAENRESSLSQVPVSYSTYEREQIGVSTVYSYEEEQAAGGSYKSGYALSTYSGNSEHELYTDSFSCDDVESLKLKLAQMAVAIEDHRSEKTQLQLTNAALVEKANAQERLVEELDRCLEAPGVVTVPGDDGTEAIEKLQLVVEGLEEQLGEAVSRLTESRVEIESQREEYNVKLDKVKEQSLENERESQEKGEAMSLKIRKLEDKIVELEDVIKALKDKIDELEAVIKALKDEAQKSQLQVELTSKLDSSNSHSKKRKIRIFSGTRSSNDRKAVQSSSSDNESSGLVLDKRITPRSRKDVDGTSCDSDGRLGVSKGRSGTRNIGNFLKKNWKGKKLTARYNEDDNEESVKCQNCDRIEGEWSERYALIKIQFQDADKLLMETLAKMDDGRVDDCKAIAASKSHMERQVSNVELKRLQGALDQSRLDIARLQSVASGRATKAGSLKSELDNANYKVVEFEKLERRMRESQRNEELLKKQVEKNSGDLEELRGLEEKYEEVVNERNSLKKKLEMKNEANYKDDERFEMRVERDNLQAMYDELLDDLHFTNERSSKLAAERQAVEVENTTLGRRVYELEAELRGLCDVSSDNKRITADSAVFRQRMEIVAEGMTQSCLLIDSKMVYPCLFNKQQPDANPSAWDTNIDCAVPQGQVEEAKVIIARLRTLWALGEDMRIAIVSSSESEQLVDDYKKSSTGSSALDNFLASWAVSSQQLRQRVKEAERLMEEYARYAYECKTMAESNTRSMRKKLRIEQENHAGILGTRHAITASDPYRTTKLIDFR